MLTIFSRHFVHFYFVLSTLRYFPKFFGEKKSLVEIRILHHFKSQKFGTQKSILAVEVNGNDLDNAFMLPATILRILTAIPHVHPICTLRKEPEQPKNMPALLLI